MSPARTESSTAAGGLALEALHATEPVRRIVGRNRTKADICLYRQGGRDVAVKDYAARPFWIRHTLGRFFVRREARAHAAAEGLPGLPLFYGRCGPFALAREWIEGKTLAELGGGPVDPALFDRLEAIVAGLHARGIALGDLHHRDVIVGPGGDVRVLDLATAWVLGARPGALGRLVFRRLAERDLVAIARLRARHAEGDEVAAVAALGRAAARRHARWRRLRTLWDRIRGKRRRTRRRGVE